jgi:DNA-binding winged helix-turn-helix (wHTH) protein
VSDGLRFGAFELDVAAGELRREGRRVALAPRPLQVLVILARRPGQLVSRHELRREVWKDAWIDVESSINTAIRELRRALGDTPTASRYIATIPRSGYRFVAPVEAIIYPFAPAEVAATAPEPVKAPAVSALQAPPPPVSAPTLRGRLIAASFAILLLAVIGAAIMMRRPDPDANVRLAISPVGARGHLAPLGAALREATLGAVMQQATLAGNPIVVLGGTTDIPANMTLDVSLTEVTPGVIRTNAQLQDVRDHRITWAKHLDASEAVTRELLPIFAESVAIQVVSATRTGLACGYFPEEGRRRQAVMKAFERLGDTHGREVIATSRHAVAAAPDSSLAHALLADAYLIAGIIGDVTPWVWAYRAALAEAREAVRLNPGDPQARAALGGALFYLQRDLAGAAAELELGIAMEPRMTQAYMWLSGVRSAAGEHASAVAAARTALAIDPLVPYTHALLSHALLMGGDAAQSEAVARRALRLAPDSIPAQYALVRTLFAQGRLDEAADVIDLPRAETGGLAPDPGAERWRIYVADMVARRAVGQRVNPFWMATVVATLGDEADAWHWLDEAVAAHCDGLLFVRSDPAFARLRASARWPSFVEAIFGPTPRHSRWSTAAASRLDVPPARAATRARPQLRAN